MTKDRYSALLLFQYRVVVDGKSSKRRLCEKRLVVFDANDRRLALQTAKRRGRQAEHRYKNGDGNDVHFEFIGVADILQLGSECELDEVWYDFATLVEPMERRKKLLPPESRLLRRS